MCTDIVYMRQNFDWKEFCEVLGVLKCFFFYKIIIEVQVVIIISNTLPCDFDFSVFEYIIPWDVQRKEQQKIDTNAYLLWMVHYFLCIEVYQVYFGLCLVVGGLKVICLLSAC